MELFWLLFFAASVVMIILLRLKGPSRALKIGSLLLLCIFVLFMISVTGFQEGFIFISISLSVSFFLTSLSLLTWKTPRHIVLKSSTGNDCPRHGIEKAKAWNEAFLQAGFENSSNRTAEWAFFGKKHITWISFLRHSSQPIWAEIHVLDNPKSTGRLLASRTAESAYCTVDRQADQELLISPSVVVQRVPRNCTTQAMLEKHLALLHGKGKLVQFTDPSEEHLSAREAWLKYIISSGKAVEKGDYVSLRPTTIPAVVLRNYAAWLH